MRTISYLWLACFCIALASCQNSSNENSAPATQTEQNVPDKTKGQAFVKDETSDPNVLNIAIGSEDHTTLVAAVQAADLENALVNAGPLTVFAPVNAAFDALPEGTVENLLKPENKETLATILKHHVAAGGYDTDLLKKFNSLGMADNTNAAVEVKGDDVYVGGAKIVASVKASNGIVHVVDAVILP
jgi:uncharacterized surface protein with fasciclin (FAS1) repeats